MKKILVLLGILMLETGLAFAGPPWISSYTATADTTQPLCTQVGKTRRGIFHGVCVSNPISGGTITIYNSSSTAVNTVAVILSTQAAHGGCNYYDIFMSTGITYTTSQANATTFMYECY